MFYSSDVEEKIRADRLLMNALSVIFLWKKQVLDQNFDKSLISPYILLFLVHMFYSSDIGEKIRADQC